MRVKLFPNFTRHHLITQTNLMGTKKPYQIENKYINKYPMITDRLLIDAIHHRLVTSGKIFFNHSTHCEISIFLKLAYQ